MNYSIKTKYSAAVSDRLNLPAQFLRLIFCHAHLNLIYYIFSPYILNSHAKTKYYTEIWNLSKNLNKHLYKFNLYYSKRIKIYLKYIEATYRYGAIQIWGFVLAKK